MSHLIHDRVDATPTRDVVGITIVVVVLVLLTVWIVRTILDSI